MRQTPKPSNLVFSPLEVSTYGTQYLKQKEEHVEFGVPFLSTAMRKRVLPMFPGEMMSIIARPGHAKTSLMMFWARQRARWLKETGHENRVVIYATWEQSVEELHSFYIAAEQRLSISDMAAGRMKDEDWKKVNDASAKRISEPLWFIGHSTMRRSGRQPITVETLQQAVEHIQEGGNEVDMLYVDYLQRIQSDVRTDSPVVKYSAIVDGLKDMALGFGIPMCVGVQASRDVEELKLPIPEMHHAQWTSNIEQSSDRVISVVRPRRYRKDGEKFGSITVTGQTQLLVNVLKQKMGEGNFAEWLAFNPIYNELDENEIRYGGV